MRELGPHLEVLLETDGEDLRHGGRGAEEWKATAPLVRTLPRTGRRADPLTGVSGNRGSGGRRAGALPGPRRTYPFRVRVRGIPPPAFRGSAKSSPRVA